MRPTHKKRLNNNILTMSHQDVPMYICNKGTLAHMRMLYADCKSQPARLVMIIQSQITVFNQNEREYLSNFNGRRCEIFNKICYFSLRNNIKLKRHTKTDLPSPSNNPRNHAYIFQFNSNIVMRFHANNTTS